MAPYDVAIRRGFTQPLFFDLLTRKLTSGCQRYSQTSNVLVLEQLHRQTGRDTSTYVSRTYGVLLQSCE